ncbi:p-loop containing nucleoside triphosphate hydrolase [Venustampulla echinocandica]|uniref:p-loop containing nucleoside triphosphate hydrolase n=1 Tax=Venustampulla echinocandica TaxID=2656787 RepID=A0A370TG23_9HELO|nr:p-loop containing nucleoside triphosphate hydrolase [Venustampulla echinocandica]RDL33857.1 p-loop containing nucleoside triphosphate hydrolase [Venustampulla echinocandica]
MVVRCLKCRVLRIELAANGVQGNGDSSVNAASGSNPHYGSSSQNDPQSLWTKMLEAAATAFASILVLGTGFATGGYMYHRFYKWLVLHKMERAFQPGDPVLELAAIGKEVPNSIAPCKEQEGDEHWILRDEQAKIDAIVDGTDRGHYHLLIGEKGTGKSSMLLDAMKKVEGEGISMFEAHADLEIFRIRLGRALNFEFHEDYIGSYFSERGPRDSTALLDIERAFNKLEKIALLRRKTVGKPLVLIVNAFHLLRDDEDGRDLIELIQQRAEQWAASNLVTVVFNSDDYWVYERLKVLATRMEVTAIADLPKSQAMSALAKYRQKYFQEAPPSETLAEVYSRVGGRLTFLNRVAKSKDMLRTCDDIIDTERRWFLNQCWILGAEMDDDVMDQQKYASAAMVLAHALVNAEKNLPPRPPDDDGSHNIPKIPLHIARQIMTRADFIQQYDHINLFAITSTAHVRADSVPMQRAFRRICAEPGFEEHLEATLQRINDIESLGRTREIVAKDLVLGGKYNFITKDGASWGEKVTEVSLEEKAEEAEEKKVDEGDGNEES